MEVREVWGVGVGAGEIVVLFRMWKGRRSNFMIFFLFFLSVWIGYFKFYCVVYLLFGILVVEGFGIY